MAKNTDLTKLDWNVALAHTVEASNDAIRVVMGASEFAIALDSTEDRSEEHTSELQSQR